MSRIILHIDMDAFFAQVEERENPHFQGKPIVVGSEPKEGKGRGVVSTANYEARKYGIKSAMPISEAWKRCPFAVFLPVNFSLYRKTSEKVMEIIKKYSPVFEQVSLDEAYLDISRLLDFEKAETLAQQLKNEIFEKEKLFCTIGVGPNKLISKIACARAKPKGFLLIKPKNAEAFLAPFDVREIPGIGPKTAEKLNKLNVYKIEDIKRISKTELVGIFGKQGEAIYEKARGIDNSPVCAGAPIKSVGKEHTFERDTLDSEIIFCAFEKIIEDIIAQLKENNYRFRTITVICRFSGFETHTKAKTLNEQGDNLKFLAKEAKKLLLKFMIENPKPIRLIGLRVKIAN